jgi:hypothetical protein
MRRVLAEVAVAAKGVAAAVRAHPRLFAGVALAAFAMHVLVPPALLSLVRKPADYFTFNPWLPKAPGYLTSGPGPAGERVDRLWNVALFWFSSDNPYGIEWGFAVTTADLVRFAAMSLIIGAYFAAWVRRRDAVAARGWAIAGGGHGGALGAAWSVFGLATGGCTVMGCGAPVIPVAGLAFAGLSSGTLKYMSDVSSAATLAVFVGMVAGTLYLGWRVQRGRP